MRAALCLSFLFSQTKCSTRTSSRESCNIFLSTDRSSSMENSLVVGVRVEG
jgi:hypothetical protein